MSFQANQKAAFVDERGEFQIQRLSCRLTFPRPILLAASLTDFRHQDTRANNTLSEPAANCLWPPSNVVFTE